MNIKNVRKQLNNYDYVMGLKKLTPSEHAILHRKYKNLNCRYKNFPINIPKNRNVENVKSIFETAFIQVEKFIKDNHLIDTSVWIHNNGLRHNNLSITGYISQSDQSDQVLIKRQRQYLINIKRIKDEAKKRKLLIKQQTLLAKQQTLLAKQQKEQTAVNILIASKEDATKIINHLKHRFKI